MFDGTYNINSYISKGNPEPNILVLYSKDGKLNGYIVEFLYRPVLFSHGIIDGNKFTFDVPPFITIVDDLSFVLSGEVDGEKISGVFTIGGIDIPFYGQRVGSPQTIDMKGI